MTSQMIMKRLILLSAIALSALIPSNGAEKWPDGSAIDPWFGNVKKVDPASLGKRYVITDYDVLPDSTKVQTAKIQAVIDRCSEEGGGLIVVPKGTFMSGSLFFRKGTSLLVEKGGRLKGSDRIADFRLMTTRIEGQTCRYFAALVNADGVDGFTICGEGTIDGNGWNYWREVHIRMDWNPQATNKDSQRPRLVYISNSRNVTVQDVRLMNSPFWTNHIYRCDHVRFLDAFIYAPTDTIKAPSSDALDIDYCHDVHVSGCYMNVCDDAVVLKGGKGTFADQDPNDGPNYNILVENCRFGTVHGCLTLGSESIHDRNVILRNCHAQNAQRVLWLKMRPDTPQKYEYITVENITGNTNSFLVIRPWTQYYDKKDRDDMPRTTGSNILIKDIKMNCRNFFDVGLSENYDLEGFTFENVDVTDEKNAFDRNAIKNTVIRNMKINGVEVK